nr:ribonuclease H-like domain-containing protein [Tanacetum cinerariifolium]
MSTQQDIYAACFENRLLCLTRRTMFHGRLVFSDYELTEKELKQIEADDQAIQTILLGLPEDIYAAVDSCETAQEIWLRVQQMMNQHAVSNPRIQNVGNQNGLIGVPGGSAEVYNYEDCYDNEIVNMFTQEEQYTELLEPIPKPHQVPQNDNNVISEVSEQKDTTCGTSANTKFAKQSILGKPPSSSKTKLYAVTPIPKSTIFPKFDETHALSNPVTSNSIPTPQESKVVKNDKVITLGMFRINLFKPSREETYVPNKVRASVRTNPITVSQPPVITKKVVNSNSNGLSSTGVENTKTRRP